MAVRVYITYGITETEWKYRIGTLAYTDEVGSRLAGSVTVFSAASDNIPVAGQPIRIADDTLGNLFGGTIDSVAGGFISGSTGCEVALTLLGWDALMDRHGVETTITYTNWKAGAILKDLFANTSISGENVATGVIIALPGGGNVNCVEDGPVITLTLSNESISSAVSKIIGMCAGYYCKIDADKVLQFHLYATIPAPFNFTAGDGHLIGQLQATQSREKYANRFVGIIKNLIGSTVTENIQGDGSTQSFNVSQNVGAPPTLTLCNRVDYGDEEDDYTPPSPETVIPLSQEIATGTPIVTVGGTPTLAFTFHVGDAFITLNSPTSSLVVVDYKYHTGVYYPQLPGTAQTGGPSGTSGKDWYYTLAATNIDQDSGGTPMTSAQILVVTYQPSAPSVIIKQNDAEITARAAVEGGTGIYTQFWTWDDPISADAAANTAQAYVDVYSSLPITISGMTTTIGLRAAMGVTFTYSYIELSDGTHPLNGQTFILQAVSLADNNGVLQWSFKAVDGALVPFGIQALAQMMSGTTAMSGATGTSGAGGTGYYDVPLS